MILKLQGCLIISKVFKSSTSRFIISINLTKIYINIDLYVIFIFLRFRYETYFVFAVVWGFGSALFQDQLVDWRNEFSKWFCNEFKTIKFPSTGNVFSFFIDPETKKFLPWSEKIENFELDPDLPLQVTCIL